MMQNNNKNNENVSRVVSEFFKKKPTNTSTDKFNKSKKPNFGKKPSFFKNNDGEKKTEVTENITENDTSSQVKSKHHQNNRHFNKNRKQYFNKNRHDNENSADTKSVQAEEPLTEKISEISETVDETIQEQVNEPKIDVKAGDEVHANEWYDPEKLVEIIGVRFQSGTKTYYFAPNGITAQKGDNVIVETARGLEFASVQIANTDVKVSEVVLPLKNVIRIATPEDEKKLEENNKKVVEAFKVCNERILFHKLDMKLVDVEYTFDNSKLLFYFTSDCRVDFRELVKDLASIFKTRIELRQIGIREETKLLGGIGICGLPFCCKSFLTDFVQVSIKMAKEQGLSLNSAKISGACGRLMCCLRYEYDTYDEEIRKTPKNDTPVMTPDGPGVVCETQPLAGLCKVKIEDGNETVIKVYHRDDLKRIESN